MAKYLVQIVIMGAQVVGKAFSRALRQELAASREAAKKTGSTRQAVANLRTGMPLDEALRILNVDSIKQKDLIEKNYKFLMEANERSKGGSFYILSKIVRAKERIDMELATQPSPPDIGGCKKKPELKQV